ncbi:uncharacterized protein LOC133197842 [Saccostrea echinata]|uniref:uncharacterized protein LOC133197842 n=1 Tax=Saccostrea echinata TaxID=191078 RepID=UPI002A801B75|nr:uncharacterized protein LOC133197842 [Saccostrea echinata]
MPKRKRRNERNERNKDKQRKKRNVKNAQNEGGHEERGLGYMAEMDSSDGLSPSLGEPLAEIQASHHEKMNRTNALRLASPQGSLSTKYVCTTPISDSVAVSTPNRVSVTDTVCTPLSVPWHQDGNMPCLADQTQPVLSMKDSLDITKDAKRSNLVVDNKLSNLVTEKNQSALVTEIEQSNLVTDQKQSNWERENNHWGLNCLSQSPGQFHSSTSGFCLSFEGNFPSFAKSAQDNSEFTCTLCKSLTCVCYKLENRNTNFKIQEESDGKELKLPLPNEKESQTLWPSIQGSFNQGNGLFGTNAGLQCVPNCLSALTYHKLRSAYLWKTIDMDKILMSGNELYDKLQEYTSIGHHYLLISDLPDALEIHNEMFSFTYHESINTMIPANFDQEMPDLSLFNAKSLMEALCAGLKETDGCFICFHESTMMVGKLNQGFFLFDSHSRSLSGKVIADGKSTCKFVKHINDVYMHIMELAHSMTIPCAIQCEITGVSCKSIDCLEDVNHGMNESLSNTQCYEDVRISYEEEPSATKFEHMPVKIRQTLCEKFHIPFSVDNIPQGVSTSDAGGPLRTWKVLGDGNCFFRAVSYYLSGSEDAHDSIRNEMCQNPVNYHCVSGRGIELTKESNPVSNNVELSSQTLEAVERERNRKRVWYRKQYGTSEKFKQHVLFSKRIYYDQSHVKKKLRKKYEDDEIYRKKVVEASKAKYKKDDMYRKNLIQVGKEKYKGNREYRKKLLETGKSKYLKNADYRCHLKESSKRKYSTNAKHKAVVQQKSIEKYKINSSHREKLKKQSKSRYESKRKEIQTKKREYNKKRYKANPEVKQKIQKSSQDQKKSKKMKFLEIDYVMESFKMKIIQGPSCVCACCHRLLFENQVKRIQSDHFMNKCESVRLIAEKCISEDYIHKCTEQCSENCNSSTLWLCKTCHRKISNGQIPAESVFNDMGLVEIPVVLKELNTLEKHLVSMHIPFMKIAALPKGGQHAIHGPVVCVPSDITQVQHLPRMEQDDMVVKVKLKRKLQYKGYYEYQFVNPLHIQHALDYLKEHNEWYADATILPGRYEDKKVENQHESDLKIGEHENEQEDDDAGDDDNNNNAMTGIQYDTCLQPSDIGQEVLDHYFDDIYNIAPAEGKNPIRMLQEKGNEAKAFPHLFPNGKNTWTEERSINITLSKYFNNRLMHVDRRFSQDTDYIFFSQYLSELKQVIDKTQISLRKSFERTKHGSRITTDMLKDPDTLRKLFKNDDALRFLQPIRGTPSFWQNVQKDLFAMLRQLGIPTWFCSFSSAEFRWSEIINILLNQEGDTRVADELDWTEKSKLLKANPVTVARMFEHRFHIFLHEVILSPAQPIGKIKDYFYRVEFQQRGSPHVHCLFWVEDAPKLLEDGKQAVCDFIDKYVTCSIPVKDEEPTLHDTVLQVQQHSKKHSKSCRKGGKECRFNFPRPPTCKTFITTPFLDKNDDDDDDDDTEMQKIHAKNILKCVWEKIQDEHFDCGKTTAELFSELNIPQDIYEKAYNLVGSKQSVILRRNPNELWTNQYNPYLLKCWDANMDIQFVLDPFSCIVYVVSYISKAEREMGMLLKQTKIEAAEGNMNAKQTMKKIGSAYLHHREVSVQEAVYRICNLRMRECSRKVLFIPVGENPTRLSKPLSLLTKDKTHKHEQETDLEIDDEEDLWMTSIVDRYKARPLNGDFPCMCLATFCSEFRVLAKSQIPKEAHEGVYELLENKGFVQRRSRSEPAVIRYPRFSAEKTPEKHFQSILQLYLPHRQICHLKPPGFDTYQAFYENGHVSLEGRENLASVKQIVDANLAKFAPNEKALDEAQEMYEILGDVEDAWATLCPETELERDTCKTKERKEVDVNDNTQAIPDLSPSDVPFDVPYTVTKCNSKEELMPLLRTLNENQRNVMYHVRDWCLKTLDNTKPEPFHIFVTGGAGTGKSHLIKSVQHVANEILKKSCTEPDKTCILLTAFTGTAAFNIGGCTIHHAFCLNKYMPFPYEPLKEQSLSPIRAELEELKILIIDEISMVYKKLLYYIHERLVQVKRCKKPFGGVSILAVGDFYQLPPVKQRQGERLYMENGSYPEDFWNEYFKLVELKEVMRQKEDLSFAEKLNSIRTRTLNEDLHPDVLEMLKRCVRDGNEEALHVFSTNEEVNDFNLNMIRKTCENIQEIPAKDFERDKTSGKLHLRDTPFVRCKNDSMTSSLMLSVNARVMLIRNICVADGLVNGVTGTVVKIVKDNISAEVKAIDISFDNKNVGKKSGQNVGNVTIVTVNRYEEDMRTSSNKNFVRHQFPLRLAWACTAHKVQGMTTSEIVVDLNRTFSAGQAYVALSRVTTERGLSISVANEQIFHNKVYADKKISDAMSKMQHLFTVSNQDVPYRSIVLHNIQSLQHHFVELLHDVTFRKADLICLTETWLSDSQNLENFALEDFQLHHVSRYQAYSGQDETFIKLKEAKGGGVAAYIKDNSTIAREQFPLENIEGMMLKDTVAEITIVVIYRPNVYPTKFFLQNLTMLLKVLKQTSRNSIIMGDFNENLLTSPTPIQKHMEQFGYHQLVTFPTTDNRTLIDHVYTTIPPTNIQVSLCPTYYSYHEAISINIPSKISYH